MSTLPQSIPGSTSERLRSRSLPSGLTPTSLALAGIVIVAAVLRFANMGAIGQSNTYYTAAVKSMVESWHNFFFAAAEPGGSVSIDKPPVAYWVQTLSAAIFGVNGFAVGLLIFTLLLAAWAFIKGTESRKLRFLILGAVLVGIGFNIKMMQAFLPLPTFYAPYFFGSSQGWWRKIAHLGLATLVLLPVALSWAVIVDLTPADQRPYVGSSSSNSELELIVGYNGLQRLLGGLRGPGGALRGRTNDQAVPNAQFPPQANGQTLPGGPNGFGQPGQDGNAVAVGTFGPGGPG